MIKLFATILSAFSLFWVGLGAGIWYEGFRPAGWPNIHVKLGWLPALDLKLPDTPSVKLASLQAGEKRAAVRTVYVTRRQAAETATAAKAEGLAQIQIHTVYRNITREVPTYVTPVADARCRVPIGFVRIHDAAARGAELPAVPDPAGQSNDAASGLDLSTVAETVVANYGAATETAERLSALQAWVRAQSAIDQTTPAGR